MGWTRREFVEAGAAAALVVSIQPVAAAVFTEAERKVLRAAMDEMVPGVEGMPAASEAGSVDYIEQAAPQIEGLVVQLRAGLAKLGGRFADLPSTARVEMLKKVENETDPEFFRALRDMVYEAYYTRPEVWRRLNYQPHPTDHSGPSMEPFDESVLEQARKRGKLYREVS